jgi:hypothetical protein
VKPVAQILRETIEEFEALMAELGAKYGKVGEPA